MAQKAVTDSKRRLESERIVGYTLKGYAVDKNKEAAGLGSTIEFANF